jgi:AraC family transcriptional regulator of adaptative response/methylated-DNA-[protein]-cysteine methyltransferase
MLATRGRVASPENAHRAASADFPRLLKRAESFTYMRPLEFPAVAILVSRIESPLGPLVAGATRDGICLLEFTGPKRLAAQLAALRRRFHAATASGRNDHTDRLERQLAEYFAGRRRRFDLRLVTPGTPFQLRVWRELARIPFGETRTYGDLARRLGVPSASRAVGHANGSNPVSIVLPCHRLIGANGALTGYGGGVWRKRKLLELESRTQGKR